MVVQILAKWNRTFQKLPRPLRISHYIGASSDFPVIETIKEGNISVVVNILFNSSKMYYLKFTNLYTLTAAVLFEQPKGSSRSASYNTWNARWTVQCLYTIYQPIVFVDALDGFLRKGGNRSANQFRSMLLHVQRLLLSTGYLIR